MVCVSWRSHAYTYIHTYIHTRNAHTSKQRLHSRRYVSSHTYRHTHTYIHTYIHTYTYTYIHAALIRQNSDYTVDGICLRLSRGTQDNMYTHTYIYTYIHAALIRQNSDYIVDGICLRLSRGSQDNMYTQHSHTWERSSTSASTHSPEPFNCPAAALRAFLKHVSVRGCVSYIRTCMHAFVCMFVCFDALSSAI